MGLIKRIANAETTVRDADQVRVLQFLAKPKAIILGFIFIGACLVGLSLGGLLF